MTHSAKLRNASKPATAPPAAGGASARTGLALASLMAGAFAYGVLGVVLVPALPLFESVLHAGESGVTWLLTAFFLSAAGSTALLGRLGDMFGKRRMLLVTLAILALGTLLCALASSLPPQIAGRALQGAAGGLFPLSLGIIRDEVPPRRVAAAIGGLTGMISLGAGGVILPGLLIPHLGWHWLFWIPFILTALAFAGTWLFIRESPARPGGTVSWLNAGLMMAGVTALVIGLSEGSAWRWSSPPTLGVLAGGLATCAAWIVAENGSRSPVINMSLMRLRPVWSTNAFAFVAGAGMYGAFAVFPVYAQLPASTGFTYGASMTRCGLYLLPFVVTMGVASVLARHLAGAFSAVRVLAASSAVTLAGFGSMALWHDHPYDMMISLALAGVGFGLMLPVLFAVVVDAVPQRNVGEVSGMNSVIRFVGGAVGTQAVSALVTGNASGLPSLHGFVAAFTALAIFMAIGVLAAVMVPRDSAAAQAA